MKITDKISWVRLFNRVFGFIFMLYKTNIIILNGTNFVFSRRFSKKNADYSSDFFFFFKRPTNWQIL